MNRFTTNLQPGALRNKPISAQDLGSIISAQIEQDRITKQRNQAFDNQRAMDEAQRLQNENQLQYQQDALDSQQTQGAISSGVQLGTATLGMVGPKNAWNAAKDVGNYAIEGGKYLYDTVSGANVIDPVTGVSPEQSKLLLKSGIDTSPSLTPIQQTPIDYYGSGESIIPSEVSMEPMMSTSEIAAQGVPKIPSAAEAPIEAGLYASEGGATEIAAANTAAEVAAASASEIAAAEAAGLTLEGYAGNAVGATLLGTVGQAAAIYGGIMAGGTLAQKNFEDPLTKEIGAPDQPIGDSLGVAPRTLGKFLGNTRGEEVGRALAAPEEALFGKDTPWSEQEKGFQYAADPFKGMGEVVIPEGNTGFFPYNKSDLRTVANVFVSPLTNVGEAIKNIFGF